MSTNAHNSNFINMINEMYSKCLKQNQDVTSAVIDIRKGLHNIQSIDKVKDKVLEKLENFEETLRMMERILHDYSGNERSLWKR